jgi:OOP family OmpA-OmpF porin
MRYVLGLLAAAFIALPVAAQDAGVYIGGHIGQASAKDFCDGVGGPGVSCEDSDTAWKALVGYQFNRNFAVELGYINFGEVEARGPGGTVSVEATAFDLMAVGSLPVVDRFSVYGKLGLYRGETDGRANTVLLTASSSESNTDLTFGFGARFDISRNFAVRAEWQRYADVGGGDVGEDDIDVISIGALFRF